MLLFFSGLFGFACGVSVTVHAPLIAELFGLKSHGLIMGVAELGLTIGGTIDIMVFLLTMALKKLRHSLLLLAILSI